MGCIYKVASTPNSEKLFAQNESEIFKKLLTISYGLWKKFARGIFLEENYLQEEEAKVGPNYGGMKKMAFAKLRDYKVDLSWVSRLERKIFFTHETQTVWPRGHAGGQENLQIGSYKPFDC